MTGDAVWYEAAFVVGATNALNVVADGLGATLGALDERATASEARAVQWLIDKANSKTRLNPKRLITIDRLL